MNANARNLLFLRIVGTITLLGLTAAFLSCADERPLAPGPVPWQAYVAYSSSDRDSTGRPYNFSFIYRWDLDSIAIVDSLSLERPCRSIVASADGKAVFLLSDEQRGDPFNISRMNATTWQRDWRSEGLPHDAQWNARGDVYLLNDGDWVRYWRSILSTANGQVIHTLPDTLHPPAGPPSGTTIAVGRVLGGGIFTDIRRIELATGAVSGLYTPHLKSGELVEGAHSGVLHQDLRRVLTFAYNPWTGGRLLLIGDLETGETLLEADRADLNGDIIITDDGSRAMVAAFDRIDIYDLDAMAKIGQILAKDFIGASDVVLEHIVLFDGESRLIVTADPGQGAYAFVHVVDLTSLQRIATLPAPDWEYAVYFDGATVVPYRK